MLDRAKAAEILHDAADLIMGPRAGTHGETQMQLTAELWSKYLGCAINERDVCQMLALLKISRAKRGDEKHRDHYLDAAAYAALAGGCGPEEAQASVQREQQRNRP